MCCCSLSLAAVVRELNSCSAQRGAVGHRVVRWSGEERRVASDEWGELRAGSVLELGWGAARAAVSWRRGKRFRDRRYVESRIELRNLT